MIKFNDFFWMVNAAPREVSDVDKTIYATKVDEYTIRSDVFNNTFEYLTFFEFTDDFTFLLFEFSFDKSFVRYNNVFEFLVDFNDFEFHCFVNENIVVADRFHVDL